MHMQNQQEQVDETDSGVKLSDRLIAEIVAVLRKRLHSDLPQLHFDPWANDQRRRGLHSDP